MKCLFDGDNLWIYEYEKTRIEITSLEEISDKLLSGVNDVNSGGIFKVEKEFAIF